MRTKILLPVVVVVLAVGAVLADAANNTTKDSNKDAATASTAASHSAQDDPMRLEGERRYRANCGRCHAAPPKFSPRMMATIVRHMRVRAAITEDDMHMILHYMTQ